MLAVSAAALGVDTSFAHVVDSVSGVDRKPTPLLLLPVDGRVATAMRPDAEDSWMSPGGTGQPTTKRQRAVDDLTYRYKRQRNNEAARRSREKRRQLDGVIRHQLEALAAENRELRCQLALFRRLLDQVAAGTLSSSQCLKDSTSGTSALSSDASDQSHPSDVVDESSLYDDVTTVSRELEFTDGEPAECLESIDISEVEDCQQRQLTPLNLSLQRDACNS